VNLESTEKNTKALLQSLQEATDHISELQKASLGSAQMRSEMDKVNSILNAWDASEHERAVSQLGGPEAETNYDAYLTDYF